jgi:TolB-like protein
MKYLHITAFFLFTAFVFSGCANKHRQELDNVAIIKQKNYENIENIYYDTLDDTISSISQDIYNSFKDKNNSKKLIVTSLVNLEDFTATNSFGRIVSESLYNDLHTKGLNLVDFRGQDTVSVNASGEFHLTRDVEKLKDEIQNVDYILVGTYSQFENESLVINYRILDTLNGDVVSTSRAVFHPQDCYEYNICKDRTTNHDVDNRTIYTPIRIINDTSAGK